VADRERVLETLRDLELADEKLAETLAELDDLARETELVRLRALDVIALREELPKRRVEAVARLESSAAEVAAAQARLAEAERAVESSSNDAEREAERFLVRARDRLTVVERLQAEAKADLAKLDRQADEGERAAVGLEEGARSLAEALEGRARLADAAGVPPEGGLSGIVQWGEGARAALFVARSQLAAERDALIRQANELGTAALGESIGAGSAANVIRRVEGKAP
jgi:hypothetical protein